MSLPPSALHEGCVGSLPSSQAALLDALPVGAIVLDPAGRVVFYNREEERLAGRSRGSVLGRDFFERVAPCMNVRELGGWFRERVGHSPLQRSVEFDFDFAHLPDVRTVRVRLADLDVLGVPHALLLIEDRSDVTALLELRERLSRRLVHDLKNPLTSVMVSLGLLREEAADAGLVREVVVDSLDAVHHMNGLLQDLLEISRLRSATMPMTRSQVDVEGLLLQIGRVHRRNPRGVRLSVALDVACEDPALDEQLVRRALENLVCNAVRFAESGVVLAATFEGDAVVFSVEDDGPGVPEALRDRLFEPFVQGPGAREGHQGLGLSLVDVVARAHGGTVSVGDSSLGGARFVLRLPLARGDEAGPPRRRVVSA